METSGQVSKGAKWAGSIVGGLAALFMIVDGVMKLVKPEIVVKTTVELGYSEGVITPLGIVLLLCTLLYLIPQTAVLGAILLTGYLGGAVATHVRFGSDAFSLVFPVIMGTLFWLGIYLRDARLRQLKPLRSAAE